MKKRSLLILIATALVFSTMVAAVPAKDDLARFTVENQTPDPAYISLSGGQGYYLTNPGDDTSVWTVARDTYNYSIYACGVWTSGSIDLNTSERLVIPVCGDKAWLNGQGPNAIDHGALLQLTRFSLVNKTSTHNLLVAVYGNGVSYVFQLIEDTPLKVTLPRGTYTYTAYGCLGSWTDTFVVESHGGVKNFKCP